MIKVLHFVSTPAIWSGVMSVIMNYYRHIDRSKIQFDFLCFIPCKSAQESYEGEIEQLGGRVFFIPKPGSSVRSIKQLKQFFIEQGKNYQWFHNHEVYLSFLLKPLSNQFEIPHFIIHCHTTKFSDRNLAALRNRVLCVPIRFMQCEKFACSVDAGEFLFGSHAIASDRVYILHNAIDVKKYTYDPRKRQALRAQMGLDDNFVIGHVGRFMPQKNHDFLISTFKEVARLRPEARLLLIGDGPLRNQLMERCQKEQIDRQVLMLGQRNDVTDWFNVMDVFALPSKFEGVGIALVEAQANGLVCAASDCVPREAAIAGNVQFLPLNSELWVKALSLLMNTIDPNHRANTTNEYEMMDTFRTKHYEIAAEAQKLQEYYENTDTHVYV